MLWCGIARRGSENGELRVASWPEAIDVAARGLAAARGSAGVLVGGRSTVEDAYAYARFARVALGTDSIDFRTRLCSAEESQFLESQKFTVTQVCRVFGVPPEMVASEAGGSLTYANVEQRDAILATGMTGGMETSYERLEGLLAAGVPA